MHGFLVIMIVINGSMWCDSHCMSRHILLAGIGVTMSDITPYWQRYHWAKSSLSPSHQHNEQSDEKYLL